MGELEVRRFLTETIKSFKNIIVSKQECSIEATTVREENFS